MEQVYIFKTSISAAAQVEQVRTLFGPIDGIKHWNIDLEDVDNILRIVSEGLEPGSIEDLLGTAGLYCENMEYEL